MRPEGILQLLRHQPFQPFRIWLSDGSEFEIRHPELALVGKSTVVVGLAGPDGPNGPVDRMVTCALVHITRTEAVNGSPKAR
jgi:hypothetical protein